MIAGRTAGRTGRAIPVDEGTKGGGKGFVALSECSMNRLGTTGEVRGATEMSGDPYRDDDGTRGSVVTRPRTETQRPSMYKVLLLNDDFTPMEFVVHVLERFFNKDREDATRIMLHVHHTGVGVCGVYTYEVAETKVAQVTDYARQHQHPLQCTMEKE